MSGFWKQFNIENLKYTVPTAWLSNKKKAHANTDAYYK